MLQRLRNRNFGALFSEGIEPEPAPPPAVRRLRRQATLRETLRVRAQRMMRVAARLARPRRLADAPAALALVMRDRLALRTSLPDARAALPAADGLAGLARDLAPAAMMEAYGKGLAPSACFGPIAWHSRERRYVAAPAALLRDARLRGKPEAADWSVSFDREIDSVLARSGRPPDSGPIMPARLLEAFAALFDAGFVHSYCVSDGDGTLIGGGFGVAVGGVFIVEGAFETKPGAAAFGLSHLSDRLCARRFALVECAPAAARLDDGVFRAMAREDFLAALALHMDGENIGRWRADEAAQPPERRLAA